MSTVRGPCPQCDRGARDRALATTTDERGKVSYCHRCGYTQAEFTPQLRIAAMRTEHRRMEPLDWSTRAEAIWRRTQSLRGTIGETYLLRRGCVLPPKDSHLRYLPPDGAHPPTLCAAVSDVLTAKPISLHFTELLTDGSGRGDRRLLAGHRKRGGCIRLWPNEAATSGLTLAEGIETALAAAHAFAPVWAAIDAGNLATFPVLQGIEALTIIADNDEAGRDAAQACAQRWREAGRAVRVLMPRTPGEDAADLARRRVVVH
jgi:hypothetical protein